MSKKKTPPKHQATKPAEKPKLRFIPADYYYGGHLPAPEEIHAVIDKSRSFCFGRLVQMLHEKGVLSDDEVCQLVNECNLRYDIATPENSEEPGA